jgi:hypothetical protein
VTTTHLLGLDEITLNDCGLSWGKDAHRQIGAVRATFNVVTHRAHLGPCPESLAAFQTRHQRLKTAVLSRAGGPDLVLAVGKLALEQSGWPDVSGMQAGPRLSTGMCVCAVRWRERSCACMNSLPSIHVRAFSGHAFTLLGGLQLHQHRLGW